MLREGHEVTLFEQSGEPGGIWVYDEAVEDDLLGQNPGRRVYSSIYPQLRTNLPTRLMAFSDYGFDSTGGGDDSWPDYPHHSAVLAYLQRFAADFALLPHIRFRETVTRATPLAGTWLIESSRGQQEFDALAVCNGHYSKPEAPDIPGIREFQGLLLHSHNYRGPKAFAGHRVALLGRGSSGADISRELAGTAAKVFWCGSDFTEQQLAENLFSAPAPKAFTRDGLLLQNGTRLPQLDAFIFCTGYAYDLPFISSEILRVQERYVQPLYKHLLCPGQRTLACIGLPSLVIPFPLMEMQSKWFARLLSGRFQLPEALDEAVREEADALRQSGQPMRHFHRLGDAQFDYMNALAAECGAPPLPDWFRPLAGEVHAARMASPEGFRDLPLKEGSRPQPLPA